MLTRVLSYFYTFLFKTEDTRFSLIRFLTQVRSMLCKLPYRNPSLLIIFVRIRSSSKCLKLFGLEVGLGPCQYSLPNTGNKIALTMNGNRL